MPNTTSTIANIVLKQSEDYELIITMDSTYTTTNKTYQAKVVKDFDGTSFTHSGSSVTSVSGTVAADNSAKTITVSFTAAQTQGFPNNFEGYWDLLEKDTTSGTKYTRQAEGEVDVLNSATPTF